MEQLYVLWRTYALKGQSHWLELTFHFIIVFIHMEKLKTVKMENFLFQIRSGDTFAMGSE